MHWQASVSLAPATAAKTAPRQGKIPFQFNPTPDTMKFTKQFQRYESDLTKFVTELRKKNPDLEAQQRAGRGRLWDLTPIDLDEQQRIQASRVNQQSYVYYHLHKD